MPFRDATGMNVLTTKECEYIRNIRTYRLDLRKDNQSHRELGIN